MTIANKYIQQCKSLFPDISYNELVKQFGSPREVVMEYYDNIEDDYLLSKIDLAKKVKKFLLFIAVLFLVYFFYQSYTTYQALNLIKDQQIIYEKQGTIEETK